MRIVGISGKSESGKDHLAKHYFKPAGFIQFSFAWHFKIWLVSTGQATYEEVFVTKPPHIRDLLQKEGTERGRMVYGENIWCNTALYWMTVIADHSNCQNFVIPDVRFPNELKFIQNNGGHVYRIIAPTRVANSKLTPEAKQHISETALDDIPLSTFTGVIFNDIGQEQLAHEQMTDIIQGQ